MVARTKVARVRLNDEEHAKFELDAQKAGFANSSEYLRSLIVGQGDIEARVTSLEGRLYELEAWIARVWAQEGQ